MAFLDHSELVVLLVMLFDPLHSGLYGHWMYSRGKGFFSQEAAMGHLEPVTTQLIALPSAHPLSTHNVLPTLPLEAIHGL